MKKLIVGLLAAFLMAAGLVAVSGTTASAAPRCGYEGCTNTNTSSKAKVKQAKRKARINFRVRTQGNAVPQGTVRIVLKGNGVFRSFSVRYPGKTFGIFKNLPKGTYRVSTRFIPGANTNFARSTKNTVITI